MRLKGRQEENQCKGGMMEWRKVTEEMCVQDVGGCCSGAYRWWVGSVLVLTGGGLVLCWCIQVVDGCC